MNISLYLTRSCNLNCRYCFEQHSKLIMSRETAFNAIKMAADMSSNFCGISFFGGEPLLQKELIKSCVEYAEGINDLKFGYNMTTNGILLDEEFLDFAQAHSIDIAFSHDGLMSRVNRLFPNGRDCLDILDQRLDMLLKRKPNTFVMTTLSPNTVEMLSESVIYLYERNARVVNLAIDYRKNAGWNDELLEILSSELKKISDYLLKAFEDGRYLVLNNYDEKIKILTSNRCKHDCQLGMCKLSIDSDGTIYPCIQFVGDSEYSLGNVNTGLDIAKRNEIYSRSRIKPSECEDCVLADRCINDCACANHQQCGNMNEVSPLQCCYQKIIIEASDDFARRMIEIDEDRFIKRYLRK